MREHTSRSIRVIQISDPHLHSKTSGTLLGLNTQQSFEVTLQHALDHYGPVDFLLLTGDIAQDESLAGYQRIADMMTERRALTYCLPGNHDDPELMSRLFRTEYMQYISHFQCKGWRFEMLNSNVPGSEAGSLKQPELEQMEKRLDQFDMPTVICVHHPPLKIGSEWLDTMSIDNGEELYRRLQFHPQVKVILCGHVHQALKIEHRQIPLLTSPSTCIQFKPKSKPFAIDNIPPGYRFFTFYEDGRFESHVERIPNVPGNIDFSSLGY